MTVTKQLVSINENWFKGHGIILSTVIFVCQTVENVKRLHVGPSSQDKGTAKFQLALSRSRLVGELMSLQMLNLTKLEQLLPKGPNEDLIEEGVLYAGAPSHFTSCPCQSVNFKQLFCLYLHSIYSDLGDHVKGI